jgi:hypothetical protein
MRISVAGAYAHAHEPVVSYLLAAPVSAGYAAAAHNPSHSQTQSFMQPSNHEVTLLVPLLQAAGPLLDVHSRLLRSLAPSGAQGALARPRHAHRLDLPTGGLLLAGKTQHALKALCSMFVDRCARPHAEATMLVQHLCWCCPACMVHRVMYQPRPSS